MKNKHLQSVAVVLSLVFAGIPTAAMAVATDVNLSVEDETGDGIAVVDITLNPGQSDEATVANDDGDNEIPINLEEGDTYTVEVTDSEGKKHRGTFVVPQGGGDVVVRVQPLQPQVFGPRDVVRIFFGGGFTAADVLGDVVDKSVSDFTNSFPSAQPEASADDDAGHAEIGVVVPIPPPPFAGDSKDSKKDMSEGRTKLGTVVSYGDPEFESAETFTFPDEFVFKADRTLEVTWFRLGLVLMQQLNEAWSGELTAGASFNRAKTTVNTVALVDGQVVDTFSDQVTNKTVSPFFGLGVAYDFSPAQAGGWSLAINAQWTELKIEDPILRGRTFDDDAVMVGAFLHYAFPLN